MLRVIWKELFMKILEQPQIVGFTQNTVNQYITRLRVKSACSSSYVKTCLLEQIEIAIIVAIYTLSVNYETPD